MKRNRSTYTYIFTLSLLPPDGCMVFDRILPYTGTENFLALARSRSFTRSLSSVVAAAAALAHQTVAFRRKAELNRVLYRYRKPNEQHSVDKRLYRARHTFCTDTLGAGYLSHRVKISEANRGKKPAHRNKPTRKKVRKELRRRKSKSKFSKKKYGISIGNFHEREKESSFLSDNLSELFLLFSFTYVRTHTHMPMWVSECVCVWNSIKADTSKVRHFSSPFPFLLNWRKFMIIIRFFFLLLLIWFIQVVCILTAVYVSALWMPECVWCGSVYFHLVKYSDIN